MLPVVIWDENFFVLFQLTGHESPHIPEIKHCNKTLKQPETVLAVAPDETEIKQNCWQSTETKQPTVGSFVLFQFYFSMCDGL